MRVLFENPTGQALARAFSDKELHVLMGMNRSQKNLSPAEVRTAQRRAGWYVQLTAGKPMGTVPILGAVASCAYGLFPGVETGAPFRVVIFHRPKWPLSQNLIWQWQSAP